MSACHVLRRVVATLLISVAAVDAARAGPEAQPDPLSAMLMERGMLLPGGELAHAVRDKASELVFSAMNFLGVPYRRGGANADDGFDCSGFTRYIFKATLGVVLPRRADEQAQAPELQEVKRDELKPGDLVFFNTLKRTFSHVGIYVGDGKFIHAPRSGATVRVESMSESYWAKRFTGARRAPVQNEATP